MKHRVLFLFLVAVITTLAYYPTVVAIEWIRSHDWAAGLVMVLCLTGILIIVGRGLWECSGDFVKRQERKP